MIVARCVQKDGAELGVPERGLYYTDNSVFHVTLGNDYVVMGMTLYRAGLTVSSRMTLGSQIGIRLASSI